MGPAIVGVSAGQINLLLNTIFASHLQTGSVSWLYYADRLMEFPTGLLGVALGTVLLPSLAKAFAEEAKEEYSSLLDWGLRLTCLLAIPAAVALAVLATPLIATLFVHGRFSPEDLVMTRQALVAYSVGLARPDSRQDPRAGVLRAAEHPHAGQDRVRCGRWQPSS